MPITIAAVRENAPHERRLALTPEVAKKLKGLGADLLIERGVGERTHVPDALFKDVEVAADAATAIGRADVLLKVQPPTAEEINALREGSVLIGYLAPHADDDRVKSLRDRRITAFAMELLPRTTRAQAMDVLSSQAGMAGYKAVLIAAQVSGKFFPMLTTAAGTIRPSKVLVVGAGVAGLQAIATARRLGAQVEGFDVRPEVKEQIESLGAKFLDLGVSAAGTGGYARELTAEEKAEQQRRLGEHLKNVDVIVTTAAVPGRPAPKIISAAMVAGMKAGSVIVDLAAETGGNCELTRPGETVESGGVSIVGPLNLPSMGAIHASDMYAKNLFNFLSLMIKDGALNLDWEDDLVAGTCLTHGGEIKHPATKSRIEGA
ncbi:Re/Si-specific NAD(P)(+) transhydrogenase subunit alpha [Pseudomarimonas salicorniae]|uniref:proton-translocating NAD(P)(+) transhydrogenase n=1 Tax=Pseudomarimonas salicorniae TaxID=2933270 RepID=A0ABT0GL82_9GAMM|nr:Re/Si-specific NAD(P)(+) transhydrogenase subunit alpha [Lysobacter sp. CAU 1642]MCK7595293.1 Re/Si-specific NAD(P)(+) transhydrogenase subunit alpha [Lysobacter sp. CAU 1642]